MERGGGRDGTPAAQALLRELRRSFLDDPDPDPEQQELARDQVLEEPGVIYPLTRIIDENEALTIDQRSVIAGFAVDIAVNHADDKKLFDAALRLVVDFLLRVSANPKLVQADSRVHLHVADALSVVNGDLDSADGYRASMKKTLKALRAFHAEAAKED